MADNRERARREAGPGRQEVHLKLCRPRPRADAAVHVKEEQIASIQTSEERMACSTHLSRYIPSAQAWHTSGHPETSQSVTLIADAESAARPLRAPRSQRMILAVTISKPASPGAPCIRFTMIFVC